MSFDWAEYLSLADRLAREASDASRRSAISRAYYAVFHAALELYQRDESLPQRDVHAALWRGLQQKGKGRRRIGVEGDRLRDARRRADYEGEVLSLDKLTESSLKAATETHGLIAKEADLLDKA